MSVPDITTYAKKIRSPFSSRRIMSNLSSTLIVLSRFRTYIALGDVHLRFSLIFITKANYDEWGITPAP